MDWRACVYVRACRFVRYIFVCVRVCRGYVIVCSTHLEK